MSLPINIDEKQLAETKKFIINYPAYAVIIVLSILDAYQQFWVVARKDEVIFTILKEKAERAEKQVDKQAELLQYWRDMNKELNEGYRQMATDRGYKNKPTKPLNDE